MNKQADLLKYFILPVLLILSGIQAANSQTAWYYQWTLLQGKPIDYIIGEASGERAYNHVVNLSEYNRIRQRSEFPDSLFEVQYVVGELRKNNLTGVSVEKLGRFTIWHAEVAQLWELAPGKEKLADAADVSFTIMPGSKNCDVTSQLIDIGTGSNDILDKIDLKGKIVLTSSRVSGLINVLIQKEAAGVISYSLAHGNGDNMAIPDMKGSGIRKESVNGFFAFLITPREGELLHRRLAEGQQITVRALVRSRVDEVDLPVVSCVIPGSDPSGQEVIISAHLFEGYGNQGANDNVSGSAAILETATTLQRLIDNRMIDKPRRNIRFIWVPEYSGTIPWVKTNREIVSKTLCNINLDMVGLSLSKYKSYFVLHRTPFGFAHYLNDVVENYMRYVGETNQVNSVVSGSSFFKRIVAPSGTDDPFYYQVEMNSGGSDHDVFNDPGVGVPGVMLITWPDPFYHTSRDRYYNIDPTQMKRAVFITAASAYTIASASEDGAVDILGEVYGNAVKRIGYQAGKAFDEINKSGADDLKKVLQRASGNMRGTALAETRALGSVLELAPSSNNLKLLIQNYVSAINNLTTSLIDNLKKTTDFRADQFGMDRFLLALTPEEKKASELIPSLKGDLTESGYNGWREKLLSVKADQRNKYDISGVGDQDEVFRLIDGKLSVLDIKYVIDSENKEETSLASLLNFCSLLREAGIVIY